MSVGEGKVYTLAAGNRVVALNKDTGAVVWAIAAHRPRTARALGNIAKVATVYHDGMVFVRHQRRQPQRGVRRAKPATAASSGRSSAVPMPGVVVTDVNGVTVDAGATWGPLQPNGQSCALTAGASPWLHGAVDPELGMSTSRFGNVRSCGSSQDGSARPGDNLFGNSIVALDLKTGAYKWHFQSVRHDIWDMDNVHSPVLADVRSAAQTTQGDLLRQQVAHDVHAGPHQRQAAARVVDQADGRSTRARTTRRRSRSRRMACGCPKCIVWEKLGTNNIPGNPWRGVPNYNGYQPDANGNLVYTEPNYLDVDKPFVTYPAGYPREHHRQGCLCDTALRLPGPVDDQPERRRRPVEPRLQPAHEPVLRPVRRRPVAHYRSAGSNGLRALGEYQTGGVFALNASTGQLAWQNHLGLDAAHGQGPLITAGDLLFVGQPDGMLYGLDAVDRQDAVEVPDRRRQRGPGDLHDQRRAVRRDLLGEAPASRTATRSRRATSCGRSSSAARYKSASGSSEMPTPAPFVVRRPVGGDAGRRQHGRTTRSTWRASEPHATRRLRPTASPTGGMSPTHMRVPVGTTVTFLNPGAEKFPNFPNLKPHCATQFFEGLFNPKLHPGRRSSTRSRRKASTSSTTAPIRVRPARSWPTTSRRTCRARCSSFPARSTCGRQRRLHQRAGSGDGHVQGPGGLHA